MATTINKQHIILLIILLMTIGQFSVTVYLPSMPYMVTDLASSDSLIQMTVTIYVLGFGCSQFIYGPLSDMYGRRIITLVGLGVFIAGSLLATVASSAEILLCARLLQGAGIGCGDTMGRAIMCDVFEGTAFVKAASYIGMASAITPVVAPIIGGYLQDIFSWRASFALLLGYGVLSFVIVFFLLPETNPLSHQRYSQASYSIVNILNRYYAILKNPLFLGYFVPGVAAFFGEILYNMVAPFLFQKQLHWSAVAYGWLSLFTAGGIFVGSIISNQLSHKLSIFQMVLCGLGTLFMSSLLMLSFGLMGYLSVVTLVLPMVIFMIGTGITYPNTNAGALTPFSHMAGIAGALQGGLQMAVTGLLGMGAASLHEDTQVPLAIILTLISCVGLIVFYYLVRHRYYVELNTATDN